MIAPRQKKKARVGVFGVGHDGYWPQFPGMKERLQGYIKKVEQRLAAFDCELIMGEMVDSDNAAGSIIDQFVREDLDLVICYFATYGLSTKIVHIAQRVDRPMLILNLQPTSAVDYARADTHELLANCTVCVIPEIASAFNRCEINYRLVTGVLEGDHPAAKDAWHQIEQWIRAAGVARTLQYARVGLLGNAYPGMVDMYADHALLHGQLGTHIEHLEMCGLWKRAKEATKSEIKVKLEETKEFFVISEDSPTDPLAKAPTRADLEIAARVSCGLDKLFQDFRLDGMAFYYRGADDNEYERLGASMILGNTFLTCKGYPCAGEGDLKNALVMLIMDSLGAGGSFSEFYLMDFEKDQILMAHDGPAHIAIASGKPILRGLGLYHGKSGRGCSVEMRVKHGPITILSLAQVRQGKLKLIVAEGESVPGEILQIGNTNTPVKMPMGVAEFVNRWSLEGPSHHWAMGVGHVADEIEKVASLMEIELVRVC